MGSHAAVIGAGAWGTALAHVLASAGNTVRLWSYEAEVAQMINEQRENTIYLPGYSVHPQITASNDMQWVVQRAELVVSVSPSQVVRKIMAQAAPYICPDAVIASASKGIEIDTQKLMHEVLREVLPASFHDRIAALSGPSFAAEAAHEMPTAVSVAAFDTEVATKVQNYFTTPFFRVYAQSDVIGVEVGGAIKNVMALAAGIGDGMGLGHNSRAAIITRGLAEMGRLGVKLGAKPITFLGLSGLGDLTLTCTGDLSRNRTVGMRLGKGEKLQDILDSMKAVAEGVRTCDATVKLARKLGVEMPISEKVWEVLYEDKPARQAVAELMQRPTKHEFWDLEDGAL